MKSQFDKILSPFRRRKDGEYAIGEKDGVKYKLFANDTTQAITESIYRKILLEDTIYNKNKEIKTNTMNTNKKRIRLSESKLRSIIAESVKKVLREDEANPDNIQKARTRSRAFPDTSKENRDKLKKKELEADAFVEKRFGKITSNLNEIKHSLWDMLKNNPRVTDKYIWQVFQKIEDLNQLIGLDSPLYNAEYNQWTNLWLHDFSNGKPYSHAERSKNNNEFWEPDDWYERNEHGDFDDLS